LLLMQRFLVRAEQNVVGFEVGVTVLEVRSTASEGAQEGSPVGVSVGAYVPATHTSSPPDTARTHIGLLLHFFLFSDGQ